MKTKSMMWAAAPLLLAITVSAATAAELTTLASASPALEADAYGAVSESLLWSFAGSPDDGSSPYANLIADKSGNLYSTTQNGGANGDGTVFELTPPHGKSTEWSERVLYSFGATSDDGTIPEAALIADKSGNLYGMTSAGGANSCPNTILPGCGTVFELSPPHGKSSTWSERVLWSFAGSPGDGQNPQAALLADKSGNLYSTTVLGGANCSPEGCGTVFELSPPYGKSTQWREQVLYSFGATTEDGAGPFAALIADQRGNLYGTTEAGGANGFGTAFELSSPYGKSSAWSEQVLHSFGATTEDGITPAAGLLADQRGDLYGTTETSLAIGVGTAFELSPPYGNSSAWSEQVLWHFAVIAGDGAGVAAGLIADKSGNLYGTTLGGGADLGGTVFELSPPYSKSAQWREQVLWSFAGSPDDGATPAASLLADKSGNLFSTTTAGGADGEGTVFKLSLPY